MTSIPPRDRALLDHAESIRSLVSNNHQLRCERDAAQRAQEKAERDCERWKLHYLRLRELVTAVVNERMAKIKHARETSAMCKLERAVRPIDLTILATQKDGGK